MPAAVLTASDFMDMRIVLEKEAHLHRPRLSRVSEGRTWNFYLAQRYATSNSRFSESFCNFLCCHEGLLVLAGVRFPAGLSWGRRGSCLTEHQLALEDKTVIDSSDGTPGRRQWQLRRERYLPIWVCLKGRATGLRSGIMSKQPLR